MTTVGRVTASAVSATNENSFSLININADFSLLKVEAPIEYHGLGAALSTLRRENAEQGPLHRTARKLGALFEQILPPINTLAEAYGKRVSEISASEKLKGVGSAKDGPFASHVGFDGTSIYAAATSGQSAIAVHFLACMLARTWSGSEATALWVELVAERKRDIEKTLDPSQIQGMAARVAARQDISRADLAKWDASARAWLRCADEVKIWGKTQLRLITKDCGMLVSLHGSTYASVLDVWTVAMTSLQKLILGMPQRISKAALLIGMSAWHIYPDLNVVGPTANVKFHDGLVSDGGVITLGLQNASVDRDDGVQWSLSLSHLRYYGDPVQISSTAHANDLRISMEDLHMVVLGTVLGEWGNEPGDFMAGSDWLIALRDCYNRGTTISLHDRMPWLDFLCTTAKRFLNTGTSTENENQKFLLSYGRRKGRRFIFGDCETLPPLLGFTNRVLLAGCSTDFSNVCDSDEVLISRLREFAQRCGMATGEGIIIHYETKRPLEMAIENKIQLVSAIPYVYAPQGTAISSTTAVHRRWIADRWSSHRPGNDHAEERLYFRSSDLKLDTFDRPTLCWRNFPPEFSDVSTLRNSSDIDFVFIAGNVTKVALFCTRNARDVRLKDPARKESRCNPTYSEVSNFLRSNQVMPWTVRQILHDSIPEFPSHNPGEALYTMRETLLGLMYATEVYNSLPGATISIGVLDQTLNKTKWPKCLIPCIAVSNRREIKFSIIAMFESGTLDIDPSEISAVMALASGNSIYVANSLLQDPSEPDYSIIRLLGNLDRPGVVMLVPPQAPLIRSVDHSSWRLVNHYDFDGELEDSFKDTSLHLSFTEYEIPLKASVGAVDAEASMLETLVSVHDQGKWVADIDVLGDFSALVLGCEEFFYSQHSNLSLLSVKEAALQIRNTSKHSISIDSWEELLDPPNGLGKSSIAVVRAGNNWNARLAAMCVSVQQGHCTRVIPKTRHLCSDCFNVIMDNAQVVIL